MVENIHVLWIIPFWRCQLYRYEQTFGSEMHPTSLHRLHLNHLSQTAEIPSPSSSNVLCWVLLGFLSNAVLSPCIYNQTFWEGHSWDVWWNGNECAFLLCDHDWSDLQSSALVNYSLICNLSIENNAISFLLDVLTTFITIELLRRFAVLHCKSSFWFRPVYHTSLIKPKWSLISAFSQIFECFDCPPMWLCTDYNLLVSNSSEISRQTVVPKNISSN